LESIGRTLEQKRGQVRVRKREKKNKQTEGEKKKIFQKGQVFRGDGRGK